LEAIDDHGRAWSFVETLKEKNAEIERLKSELRRLQYNDEVSKNLITKLADALESLGSVYSEESWKEEAALIQRARKAINVS
jgi:hypothetical protein